MSVDYMIACRDCKVTRDLGTFYECRDISTRQDAIELADEIKRRSTFRAALLASFMGEHMHHDCVLFTDCDDIADELDPFDNQHGFKEDTNYWADAVIPRRDTGAFYG